MSRKDTREAISDLRGFEEVDHAELTRTEGGVMARVDSDGVVRTCTEPPGGLLGKFFPKLPQGPSPFHPRPMF